MFQPVLDEPLRAFSAAIFGLLSLFLASLDSGPDAPGRREALTAASLFVLPARVNSCLLPSRALLLAAGAAALHSLHCLFAADACSR